MPCDEAPDFRETSVASRRRSEGSVGYHKGLSAESQVIRHYESLGAKLLHHRWRGSAGELDLILELGDDIIMVEVKASRSLAQAATRLSPRQCQRIFQTAEEYLATCPRGQLTPMRLDVALVDNEGTIEILENALMDA